MATDLSGLFGGTLTPEEQQRQQIETRAAQFAQLAPSQQLAFMGYKAGAGLGQGLAQAAGVDIQDPAIKRATMLRQLAQGLDVTSIGGLQEYASRLQQAGFNAEAAQLGQSLEQRKQQAAQAALTSAKGIKELQALDRSDQARKALAELGPDASEEDILKVVRQYGDVKDILSGMEATQRKKLEIQARQDDLKARLEAQLAAARERGATQKEIAEMQIQGRKEIAALAAALKGPSAAVLKAQERADKIAEGKEGLENTLGTATKLINDISNLGGMTSTSSAPLANLITSLGTSAVGQFASGLVGTETQAKRDELGSIRLQLLNAVKEATGMSSQQLNSNVELQTWLKSLGSASMTKEANLAILNNISNRYLKKDIIPPTPPAPTPTPKTPGKPISWNSLP